MKKPPALQLEEIQGDKFPDLDAAQRAALPQLCESLQSVIRDLLERGELVNVNGKIIPNPTAVTTVTAPIDKVQPCPINILLPLLDCMPARWCGLTYVIAVDRPRNKAWISK